LALAKFIHIAICLSLTLNPLLLSPASAQDNILEPGIEVLQVIATSGVTNTTPTLLVPGFNLRTEQKAEVDHLRQTLDGFAINSPLDRWRLLDIISHENPKAHFIDYSALTYAAFDSTNTQKVLSAHSKRFKPTFLSSNESKLQIHYQGKLLYDFRMPVIGFAVFGDYLVFVEKHNLTPSGVQSISFIDLKSYDPILGRVNPPVFKIPVQFGNRLNNLDIKNNQLHINQVVIGKEHLNEMSLIQQSAYNINVNMLDPKALTQMQPLGDGLQEYLMRAVELKGKDFQQQMQDIAGSEAKLLEFAKGLKGLKKDQSNAVDSDKLMHQDFIEKTAKNISANIEAEKRLLSKLHQFWARMTLPQPNGAPKIIQGLALIASAFSPHSKASRTAALNEGILRIANHPNVQIAGAIVTGTAMGIVFPEQMAHLFYLSTDLTRSIMNWAIDGSRLTSTAFMETFAGLNPSNFYNAYLAPDKISRFGIGLGAIITTLYMTLGIPHLIVNSYLLFKDLRKIGISQFKNTEVSWLGALKTAFIKRQNSQEKTYLEALATSHAKQSGKDKELEFTAEQNAEAEEQVRELEQAQREGGFYYRMLKAIGKTPSTQQLDQKSDRQISTLFQAIKHFTYSYCSFTNSGRTYTRIWNNWFALRSFIWKPKALIGMIIYPKLYARATRGVIPNKINGGMKNRFEDIYEADYRHQVDAWETQFINVEKVLYEHAFKKSFQALVNHMNTSNDLHDFFKKEGIANIYDKKINKFTEQNKIFFENHFNLVVERASELYLQDLVSKHGVVPQNANLNLETLKNITLPYKNELQLDASVAQRYVEQVITPELLTEAKIRTENETKLSATNLFRKYVHRVDPDFLNRQLNPLNNRQVARMQVVERQINNPQAMARAVRSMIAGNIVDKPQELFFTFLLLAGVTDPILRPIQDSIHSPTSWYYLSRMVFFSGYTYAVISGVLSDVWLKIQQDEMHEGQFGKVPTKEELTISVKPKKIHDQQGRIIFNQDRHEREMTYFEWYKHQLVKNPDNTLLKAWSYYNKLIWANMPAAFTTHLTISLGLLKRFDIDSYITSYSTSFGLPLGGLQFQTEQAFELAAGYRLKDIKEELRAHPTVQEYFNRRIGKDRFKYNLAYRTWENVTGQLLQNMLTIGVPATETLPEIKTRAFSRLMLRPFAGDITFAKAAVDTIATVTTPLVSVPGVKQIGDGCVLLLTNGLPAATLK